MEPAAQGLHHLLVAIVEDDDGLRIALQRMLRAWGYHTLSYDSAEAALGDAVVALADCLVVDLNLPAMSGLELVERLRERGVHAPTVAISAHDERPLRQRLCRSGIEHFLAKPFRGSALVRSVDAALAERRSHE
ncbi:MAG TPA: response regulator [Rubrivivax sp.]|nr:response regulator [Rubrivivax sp.]HPO19410.1 response regulator [Rubrivivax sp.]